MSDERDDRLREHPRDRFAPAERLIDLDEQFDDLLSEPHGAVEGHRQIALAHRKGMRLVLMHFEEGGHVPDHQVDGAVTIHVLEGDLDISTSENDHRVNSGQMLMLKPGVNHEIEARTASKMLMTVAVGND
ncbi:MAG: cupin domain-containing protein [Bradymonadaceae bacterium]